MIKSKLVSWLIIIAYLALTVAVLAIGPTAIIESIGTTHALLAVFIIACVAGSSTFSSTPFYVLVASLGAAGVSPWLLMLAGGPGLIAGDILHYYLGESIEYHLPSKAKSRLLKIATRLKNSKWRFGLSGLTFIWAALFPIPVDLLMIMLAMVNHPFKKWIVPLALGELTFVWLLAHFSSVVF